jgi:hypothetical protein
MDINFNDVTGVYIENYKSHFKTIIVQTRDGEVEINLHGAGHGFTSGPVKIISLPKGELFSSMEKKELDAIVGVGEEKLPSDGTIDAMYDLLVGSDSKEYSLAH